MERMRRLSFLVAMAAALALPAAASASFHLTHVNEVMTSNAGSTGQQFVELTDPSEPYPDAEGPYGLKVYDAGGAELGSQTIDKSKLQTHNWSKPFLISTAAADTALGSTGDAPLTVSLPQAAGQACFVALNGSSLVGCVAWGCVTKTVGGATAAPAPADGQSTGRQSDGTFTLGTPTPAAANSPGSAAPACPGQTKDTTAPKVTFSPRATLHAVKGVLKLRLSSSETGRVRVRITLGTTLIGTLTQRLTSTGAHVLKVHLTHRDRLRQARKVKIVLAVADGAGNTRRITRTPKLSST